MNFRTLVDKANIWKSEDTWSLETFEDLLVSIENTSKNRILGAINNEVILLQENVGQMWRRGPINDEGYFTLTHLSSGKLLTAKYVEKLSLEGKIQKYIRPVST